MQPLSQKIWPFHKVPIMEHLQNLRIFFCLSGMPVLLLWTNNNMRFGGTYRILCAAWIWHPSRTWHPLRIPCFLLIGYCQLRLFWIPLHKLSTSPILTWWSDAQRLHHRIRKNSPRLRFCLFRLRQPDVWLFRSIRLNHYSWIIHRVAVPAAESRIVTLIAGFIAFIWKVNIKKSSISGKMWLSKSHDSIKGALNDYLNHNFAWKQ